MSNGPLCDLRDRRHHPDVLALLELAVERFDAGQREATVELYGRPDALLLGWVEDDEVRGVIGGLTSPEAPRMLHLAVVPEHRHRGIAAHLVARFAQRAGTPLLAETDGEARTFWERIGAATRPVHTLADGTVRHEVRLDHIDDPGPEITWPEITATSDRSLSVTLPPEGNTLPLVPATLRDRPIPAFVTEWILQTDEVGLLLQDVLPDHFPPTTPSVRPADRGWAPETDLLGWRAEELPADPDALLPGLPAGVDVPVRVAEVVVAAERIGQWLRAARRVRRWADSQGHGDDAWIE